MMYPKILQWEIICITEFCEQNCFEKIKYHRRPRNLFKIQNIFQGCRHRLGQRLRAPPLLGGLIT